jgi:2-oxoglutarate/2-oxoacid ferredoxin oxidoreductase subunit alpha
MSVETQGRSIRRPIDKLNPLAGDRAIFETEDLDDAEVVVASYGITSRVAQRALQLARARGIRAGKFRIISAWPFPDRHIRELAGRVKAFVVAEINLGQMVHEVLTPADPSRHNG